MKISVLASGSKGNSTFIEINNVNILIDLGMSCNYIEKKLKEINVNPETIKKILITHTHNDHICGLPAFYKKYKPKICIMPSMIDSLKPILGDFTYESYENHSDQFALEILKTSHDSKDSVGFIIDKKIVYITDTGYLNSKYFDLLKNKEVYIFESNHDIEMLIDGNYYFGLKQRILSDKGHLSNKDAAKYLAKFIGNNTKYIFLAHLSEDNNTKEKALETLLSYIKKESIKKIIITDQYNRTELIEL